MGLQEKLRELIAEGQIRAKRLPNAMDMRILHMNEVLCTPSAAETLQEEYGIAIDPGATEDFPDAGRGITQRKFADFDISNHPHRVKFNDAFRGGAEGDSLAQKLGYKWDKIEEIFKDAPPLACKPEALLRTIGEMAAQDQLRVTRKQEPNGLFINNVLATQEAAERLAKLGILIDFYGPAAEQPALGEFDLSKYSKSIHTFPLNRSDTDKPNSLYGVLLQVPGQNGLSILNTLNEAFTTVREPELLGAEPAPSFVEKHRPQKIDGAEYLSELMQKAYHVGVKRSDGAEPTKLLELLSINDISADEREVLSRVNIQLERYVAVKALSLQNSQIEASPKTLSVVLDEYLQMLHWPNHYRVAQSYIEGIDAALKSGKSRQMD